MNQRALMAAAAASLLSTLLVSAPAAAQEKEKCYGITTAGQNDCANLSGSHSCAGQSKVGSDVNEWKYVAKGTCASMKGLSADAAKAQTKIMTDKKG
ncbi:MAG: DUF2282 domain-containing protein [Pseudomonadota bacterium]